MKLLKRHAGKINDSLTATTETLPGGLGNSETMTFISGEQENKGNFEEQET